MGQSVRNCSPVDIAHECLDVRGRIRAKLHLIRVLVHIEHKQWNGVQHCLGVVKSELVVQLAVLARVGQHHPAGTTAERVREANELAFPGSETAKVLFESRGHRSGQLCTAPRTREEHGPVSSQAAEVQLVQSHRAHSAELGLFQRAYFVVGCSRRIELRESTPDAI